MRKEEKDEDDFELLTNDDIRIAEYEADKILEEEYQKNSHGPPCKCDKDKGVQYCDSVKYWLFYIKERTGAQLNISEISKLYDTTLKIGAPHVISTLIKNDVESTYSNIPFFTRKEGNIGKTMLKNVLQAVAIHQPLVGYIPGMNFIAATFLYHSSPVVAFWLLLQLLEVYKQIEVYQPGCPGLLMHSSIIELLLSICNPTLNQFVQTHNISIPEISQSLMNSLCTNVVPLDISNLLFMHFFNQSWLFFYKLILLLLQHNKEGLAPAHSPKAINSVLSAAKWELIISEAANLYIDTEVMQEIWKGYDMEEKKFKVKFTTEMLQKLTNPSIQQKSVISTCPNSPCYVD